MINIQTHLLQNFYEYETINKFNGELKNNTIQYKINFNLYMLLFNGPIVTNSEDRHLITFTLHLYVCNLNCKLFICVLYIILLLCMFFII